MKSIKKSNLITHFSILPDPRQLDHNKFRHELIDVIVIVILAMICGADTWTDIETFGKEKEDWLKRFLTLENGIPSHDTLGRIFSILNPDIFEKCFVDWTNSVRKRTKGEVIAIDGKTMRRAHGKGLKPIHIVSAYATENGIVLGQRTVNSKTNEITAIPELLKMLYLKGCIVTTDAMGCQTNIVKKVIENKADYVLAVKENQPRLLEDITETFENFHSDKDYVRTSEQSHGREEVRECWVSTQLSGIRDHDKWTKLSSVAKITDTRTIDGKTTTATRYFISSLKNETREILHTVRSHWKIENSLHWSLDVAFREDESRIRIGSAAKNLAIVRKIALNLLRTDTSRGGFRNKRYRAALSNDFLLSVIGVT